MQTIFTLLVLYQIKHFVADYPLQTPYMLGKFKGGTEWIKPLLAHVAVHGFFTALICAYYKPELMVPLTLLDMTIHFVMDRIKASPQMLGRFKALSANEMKNILSYVPTLGMAEVKKTFGQQLKNNVYFWWALGLDQGVHHLTHYLLIWLLVR